MDDIYSYYDYIDNQNQQYAEYYNDTIVNAYESPYNMHFITPPMFLFICIIALFSMICCMIMCFVVCKVLVNSRQNLCLNANTAIKSASMHNYCAPYEARSVSFASMILTMICILLYTFCNIMDPFAYYTRFVQYSSDLNYIIYRLYNLIWILAKISFYLVLMHRYYLLFDASYFNDTHLMHKKLLIFCCFGTMLLFQLIFYFGFFIIYYELITNNVSHHTEIMKYSMISFLFMDLCLICILGYLFIISVFKLVIQIRSTKEKNSMFEAVKSRNMDFEMDLDAIEENEETETDTKHQKERHIRVQTNTSINSLANLVIDYDLHNENEHKILKNKTNISLNAYANSNSSVGRLNTDTTVDIQHRYKLTSSSMPDYCPANNINIHQKDDHDFHIIKYDDIYSKKQLKLLNITTKIALTSFISMCASFTYQLIWFIGLQMNDYRHIIWFTHISCLEALISIICIFLQLEISKYLYKKLCIHSCKCHLCCFKLIQSVTQKHTQYNQNIRNVHTIHNLHVDNSRSITECVHHI